MNSSGMPSLQAIYVIIRWKIATRLLTTYIFLLKML